MFSLPVHVGQLFLTTNLLQLKTTLEQHLPESLQILNVVILTIAEDGINRTVIVNDNFDTENVAVVVIYNLETPRLNITMFSSKAKKT